MSWVTSLSLLFFEGKATPQIVVSFSVLDCCFSGFPFAMFIHDCNKKFLLSFVCAAGLFLILFLIEIRLYAMVFYEIVALRRVKMVLP